MRELRLGERATGRGGGLELLAGAPWIGRTELALLEHEARVGQGVGRAGLLGLLQPFEGSGGIG